LRDRSCHRQRLTVQAVSLRADLRAAHTAARRVAVALLSTPMDCALRCRLCCRFSRLSPIFEVSESGTDARFPSEVRHFVGLSHPSQSMGFRGSRVRIPPSRFGKSFLCITLRNYRLHSAIGDFFLYPTGTPRLVAVLLGIWKDKRGWMAAQFVTSRPRLDRW
jgi:hypothetical protein